MIRTSTQYKNCWGENTKLYRISLYLYQPKDPNPVSDHDYKNSRIDNTETVDSDMIEELRCCHWHNQGALPWNYHKVTN